MTHLVRRAHFPIATSLAAFWHRYWVDGFLWLTLAMAALVAVNLVGDLRRPHGGYVTVRWTNGNSWYLSGDTPTWWPALTYLGLRHGDRLVALNGMPYGPTYGDQFAALYARGEHTALLTIERQGISLTLAISIAPFTLGEMLDMKLPRTISAFSFWLIALAIYRSRRASPLNRACAVGFNLLACIQFNWMPGLFMDDATPIARLADLVWVMAVPFIGVTLFYAAALFTTAPEVLRHSTPYRVIQRAGYGIAMLTSIIYLCNKLRWWSTGWSPLTGSLDTGAFFVSFATDFGGSFLALMLIAWASWRGRAVPRLKRQGLIILAGALIALPALALQFLSPFNQAEAFYFDGLDLRYL